MVSSGAEVPGVTLSASLRLRFAIAQRPEGFPPWLVGGAPADAFAVPGQLFYAVAATPAKGPPSVSLAVRSRVGLAHSRMVAIVPGSFKIRACGG